MRLRGGMGRVPAYAVIGVGSFARDCVAFRRSTVRVVASASLLHAFLLFILLAFWHVAQMWRARQHANKSENKKRSTRRTRAVQQQQQQQPERQPPE